MTDPQRREEIERIYHLARERKAEEHEKFLEEACGGDDFLGREVQSLLARPAEGQHQRNGDEGLTLEVRGNRLGRRSPILSQWRSSLNWNAGHLIDRSFTLRSV